MAQQSTRCAVNNFKLMYQHSKVLKKASYLKQFSIFLKDIKDVVSNDLTMGLISVKNDIEVELVNFFQDEINHQTLIYLTVRVTLQGDFDTIEKENPETVNNLFDFVDEWLNSFDPEADKPVVTSRKKKATGTKKRKK